ncbi:MAG: DUF1211 domain-containing protein [Actinomycetia bacterium]|nr:DUF1211 domain-containing protein [Actinomycetes bacterium]
MVDDGGPQTQVPDRRARHRDPSRVAAFTDGVFAIIITILVLEISVPADLPSTGLREALDEVGPTLIAWVISFGITGTYWVWHRDLFAKIRYADRGIVWLNLLFLLPTALIPFASALLGEYHGEPVALHVYGVVLIAASLARTALYGYVVRNPDLLWEPTVGEDRRVGWYLAAAPIVIYLLAMAVADWSPTLSLLLYLCLPLLYFLLITVLRSDPETSEGADDFS